MSDTSDLAAFYIVDVNDETGEGAHGPYSMVDAETLLKEDEKIITRQQLATMRADGASLPTALPGLDTEKMRRDIRVWGGILLFIAAFFIFSNGLLNSAWSMLLIVLGLTSFFIPEAAMYAVHGVIFCWVVFANLTSGSGGWAAFSFLQAFFGFQTFRQFFRYRNLVYPSQTAELPGRAPRLFPWGSAICGVLSPLGLVLVFVLAVLTAVAETAVFDAALGLLEGLVVNLGILAVALGVASLLSRFRYRLLAVLGLVGGGLVLLVEIGLSLFG